jgi:dihydroorotate dehydrogenase
VDGIIATNTSNDLTSLGEWPEAHRGGLSGAPLHALSVNVIRQLRTELGDGFPIVGVGGIVSGEHAIATLEAGANLIQIYTGFAYRGYELVDEILHALARCRAGRGAAPGGRP